MLTSNYTSEKASVEFLQLLTAQLRNQNPLEPVKQENFVGQLAQFSTLEGVEKLNTNFQNMLKMEEISQGLTLVGKNVDYLDINSGDIKSGRVDEFFVDQGNTYLIVNGQTISIDYIAGVKHNANTGTGDDTPPPATDD